MLKEGATTTFEAWGADQKWNTSLCHPAAGMPVWIIIEHLMGLTPAEPGFKTVRVAPRIPAALTSIEVRFPTVSGTISALYKKDKGYFLSVPENTPVIDDTPQHIKLKLVNTLPPEESVK
jgi:alpha-L-rhamnosidase